VRVLPVPAEREHRLRRNATDAERALWRLLRSHQLEGYKFRRQHSVGPYILDFYCPAARLAVEVDGSQHYTPEGLTSDAERTAHLGGIGIRMLRFTNVEVTTNADGVASTLLRTMEERCDHE
jgi:very-short-patch-repair endonuclease